MIYLVTALILSMLTNGYDEPQSLERWRIGGFQSKSEVETIFELFPKAVKKNDSRIVKNYIPSFPIEVNCKSNTIDMMEGKYPITDNAHFQKLWEFMRAASPTFENIQNSSPETENINYLGIGLGRGSIWVSPMIIDDKYSVKILAINTNLECSKLRLELGIN